MWSALSQTPGQRVFLIAGQDSTRHHTKTQEGLADRTTRYTKLPKELCLAEHAGTRKSKGLSGTHRRPND
ncbi:hypothetical protein AGOR_G00084290 [Albula goreensis]|uniref:Uncharacterized protein n=1 Tax=Albula goreensis TaxID=1534307 RepID=A0A8T3DQF0_9TELE|nr:hypothetical protein AGOR_G00084290 [Albula goreensis]